MKKSISISLRITCLLLCFLLYGCELGNASLHSAVTVDINNIVYGIIREKASNGHQPWLVLFEKSSWKEVGRARIDQPGTIIRQIDQDPQGRIWIGYLGEPGVNTRNVDIFLPNGEYYKTIQPCANAGYHIYFSGENAFVICVRNGFQASVAVVNIASLETVKTIDVDASPYFMLLASGKSGNTILLVGNSDSRTTFTWIDCDALEIKHTKSITLGGGNFETILTHDTQFLLLNTASYLHSPERPNDILIMDAELPDNLSAITLPQRSPLLGVVKGGELYAYHNSEYHTDDELSRSISRLNFATGVIENWPLPDYWDARDMDVVDGRILLVRKFSLNPEDKDGIYEFDPTTGTLSFFKEIPGLQLLFVPSKNKD